MFNRIAALWLVAGILAGYAVAGPAVKAQNASGSAAPLFVVPGDDLTLQFERGTFSENSYSIRCAVLAVESTWLKCAPPDAFGAERTQKWVNLAYAVQITRRDK